MNLSGIVVSASPGRLDEVLSAFTGLPGIEVHQVDRDRCRFVVVQEAPAVEDEAAGLRRLQQVPGVASAELVYHYFEHDPVIAAAVARDPVPAGVDHAGERDPVLVPASFPSIADPGRSATAAGEPLPQEPT